MGLFGRLRSSSSAQARPAPNEAPPPLPLPPPPTASLYASSSRLSINPSESSPAQTPKSSKSFWKRKGKGIEKDVVGFSYESTSPATGYGGTFTVDRPQRSRESLGSVLAPTPSRSVNSQSASNGYGLDGRGQDGRGYTRPEPQHENHQREEYHRMDGDNMSTPRQQQYSQQRSQQYPTPKGILKPKAMLGKLDFEQDSSTDEEKLASDRLRHSSYTAYDAIRQPVAQPNGQRPHTMMMSHQPESDGHTMRDISAHGYSVPQPRMSMEEQMEHLVSPEKKQVWTPQSRRMSVSSDVDEPSSPTPRKNNLPPQDLGTPTAHAPVPKAASSDGHHSQPHSTRRPSSSRRSSFIPLGNPFARSSTRLSLSNDGQNGDLDDGSFQLRGFRHVSGASEADFAWNPPAAQVDSSPAPAPVTLPITTTTHTAPAMVTSPISVQAPTPSRPSSTQPIPSRPVSRATSLQSLDDHISASTKVSAAAFRKKIRRPSESASTHLDIDDDDDDDVPLGMLRPGMRTSSAISLSSMKEGARTPGSRSVMKTGARSPVRSPARTPITSTGLSTTPSTAGARALSPAKTPEGRKVPARSRTTPLISPDEIHPMFPSPASSPKLVATKVVAEPEDVGYFGLSGAGNGESQVPETTSQALDNSPLFDFKTLDYPIDAFTTSPQAVKTVKTTESDGKSVPLAPPIADPSSAKLSLSIPETEKKSKDVNNASTRQDTLDTDFVVRSMALYADEANGDENEPPTPRVALHQQLHSTLFGDTSSDNSTIRSPLSERLGNLVGPRPMSSKPSLPKLDTLKLEDGNERIKSPGSDTTLSPTVSTIRDHQSVPSSFARQSGAHMKPQAGRAEYDESDESESEGTASDEEDEDVPPKRPEGPPRSSFTNAPRPRIGPSISHQSISQAQNQGRTRLTRESSASDDSDDSDRPLARIRSKASRSKLAASNMSASGRPRSAFEPLTADPSTTVSSAKAATTPLPSAPPHFAGQVRRSSVPTVVSAPMAGGKSNGAGPASPTKRIWSASPASSQSGLTGDSSGVQPVTPSEHEMGDGRGFKAPPAGSGQQQWGESKRSSVSWAPEHRSRRNSNYSVATAPPEHGLRTDENAPPVPSMPSGIDPMDPMMRQRMKEVWQAQYMAAASRAFEDEWERQSTASASVAAPSVAPQQSYSAYPAHSPQPQTLPHPHHQIPGQSPYGMPMGYGFPHQMPPMPHMPHMPPGYMYPGWNPMSPHGYPQQHQQQPEPSMYAYGAGAQSVYGAEFGPSQAHMTNNGQPMSPYARPTSMSFPQSYSTSNLHQPSYDNHIQHHQHQQHHHQTQPEHQHQQSRPSLPSSRSTSYFSHSQPLPTNQNQQTQHHRQSSRGNRESDLDYTPPPSRGLIHSVPNSPRGAGAGANRRSHLGTSVISANDRASNTTAGPPPTSWRRSSAMPLLAFDEEEATPKKKRVSVIIN